MFTAPFSFKELLFQLVVKNRSYNKHLSRPTKAGITLVHAQGTISGQDSCIVFYAKVWQRGQHDFLLKQVNAIKSNEFPTNKGKA